MTAMRRVCWELHDDDHSLCAVPRMSWCTLIGVTGEGKLVPRHAVGFHTVWAVRARQPLVWATRQCVAGMIDVFWLRMCVTFLFNLRLEQMPTRHHFVKPCKVYLFRVQVVANTNINWIRKKHFYFFLFRIITSNLMFYWNWKLKIIWIKKY